MLRFQGEPGSISKLVTVRKTWLWPLSSLNQGPDPQLQAFSYPLPTPNHSQGDTDHLRTDREAALRPLDSQEEYFGDSELGSTWGTRLRAKAQLAPIWGQCCVHSPQPHLGTPTGVSGAV